MKTIEEIIKIAEEIEKWREVREVIIRDDCLDIYLVMVEDDTEFFKQMQTFEEKVIKLTGVTPTPSDVKENEWYIFFNEI